ncbi:DUF6602 domain-containing protein [Roseovarius sp. 10]|uniref:DUF6602 domain-containing protein n=1 Tax=Roseovarius sp. 10 TaxID=3080563 RepID=UPI002952B7AD|nr:DUF6602 domain-containing protein [Roseovarius sp. 10]MDV7202260.1 DUF6602 domain-containing protein [Roseovarius sp. 10]
MSKTDDTYATALHSTYSGLQARLSSGLASNRSVLKHPVAKGNGAEANWLKMLQDHLPHRYQAEAAFVIDAQGHLSEQIDIVLYDRQYTPELYNVDGQKIIPAEGVYAVFEVKQVLDRANVAYACKKVASVRRLKRTSAPIVHAGGEHQPRGVTPILGGLLATESGWKNPFGKTFSDCLRSTETEERLDIGCVPTAGAFEAIYDNNTINIIRGEPEFALASFFMRLLHRLQRIGTVPAINYAAYLKAFERDL